MRRFYEFGPFRLDPDERVLYREGLLVTLAPKDVDTLVVLLQNPGRVVAKGELLERVWPGTFVEEGNLARHISNLRQVLGEEASGAPYIETIPKRGYRFLAAIREVRDAEPAPARWVRPSISMWVGAALLALALLAAYARLPKRGHEAPLDPDRVMLAILPFANLSGDPELAYLADGLTEELIAQLGRLDPAGLGVIARTSAMRYRGADKGVAQIGRELKVHYIVEGSVRPADQGRVRITAQLIRVSDQAQRWNATVERGLGDGISLQTEVARAVAEEVRLQLGPEARVRLGAGTLDATAHTLWLKGRHAWNQRTARDLRAALELFEGSVSADPAFAPAYAGLAATWTLMPYYAGVPPGEAFPKARAAARKALEIDPYLAEAHTSLGYVAHRHDWDWPAAETSYRRALDLNPSYSTAHHWYAELLIVTGRLEEAREEMARACRFDPLSPQVNLDSGLPDYFSERYDGAVEQSRRVLAMDERFVPAHVALQNAYEQLGQYAEAIAELRRTAELVGADPSRLASLEAAHAASGAKGYWSGRLQLALDGWPLPQSPAHVANVLAAAGDNPRALEWLERAYAARDDELVWIAVEPWYRALHVEPRFQELCRRMGLKPSS